MRVGYACICLGDDTARCQRTTILRSATPERLRELIQSNLDGLERILQYNEAHDLRLFRIGNSFIPFASHPVNELRWWEEHGYRFRYLGRWVRGHGHRLSFHASHFTILNSENPAVVEAALADVAYMARVLEAMELGPEHKIILHLGVSNPTPEAALERLAAALDRVPPEFRCHLVLENDERFYSADQAVAFAHRVGLPVVVDVLHHACNPGAWADVTCAELMERVFTTWSPEDGPPKMHFSSQDPDKKTGAHGYWIDGDELERFLVQTRAVSRNFDIMFEAKGKDEAVLAVLPILRQDPRFQLPALAA
jgi:UV DNA damage endonuclease